MFSFEINFGLLKCADAGGVKDQTDKSILKIDCLLVEAFGSKGKRRFSQFFLDLKIRRLDSIAVSIFVVILVEFDKSETSTLVYC